MSEKPSHAGIEAIVNKQNAVEEAFNKLKKELSAAFDNQIRIVETKLKSVTAENERLHHERLLLAKEIQRRRSQEAKILEIFERS